MVTNFTGRRDVDCSSSSLTFDYGFSMNSAANESWRDDPDRPSRNSGILEEDWEKRMIQSMLDAGTLTFKELPCANHCLWRRAMTQCSNSCADVTMPSSSELRRLTLM